MQGDGGSCGKCRVSRAQVVTHGGNRCHACFDRALVYAFKTTMTRNEMAAFRVKLGVAVSGGLSSSTLALLVAQTSVVSQSVQASAILFHVHTGNQLEQAAISACEKLANATGLELKSARLHPDTVAALSSIPDQTDRRELRRVAVMDALCDLAANNNCSRLLLGSNATRIAADVLRNVITGRGHSLVPACVAYSADVPRSGGPAVTICRPLRDISAREIVRWGVHQGALELSGYDNPAESPMHLDGHVERFVLHLQADRLSTANTVVKTAAKLDKIPDKHTEEDTRCVLCRGYREPPLMMQRRPYSRPTAALSASPTTGEHLLKSGVDGRRESSDSEDNSVNRSSCCYACSQVVSRASADSSESLAAVKAFAAQRRRAQSRDEIRAQIESCILQDEDDDDEFSRAQCMAPAK